MRSVFTAPAIRRLVRRFGTPLYAYDFDELQRRALGLRGALSPRFDLFYAVKANPSLAVLSLFARLGLGADVASRGELALALRAGFSPDRIVMTGPAKSDADLEPAVRARIFGINAEGEHELERMDRIARRLHVRVPVQLRLNPDFGTREERSIIGGSGGTKFGMDLPTAERVLAHRGRWRFLDFGGFQVFQASNVLSADRLLENVRRVLAQSRELSLRFDLPLRTIDFGGGLGVPYAGKERPLDVRRLSRGLRSIARQVEGDPLFGGTRLLFEPGRWLVADAGIYVSRVIEVKRVRGEQHVLVDGGIHHFARPALVGSPHPIRIVPVSGRPGRRVRFSIGGPLCTALDSLCSGVLASLPRPGDLVVAERAGAYGFTESMPLFLSHEWPAEIGVRGNRAVRLRKAPTVDSLIAQQRAPGALVGTVAARSVVGHGSRRLGPTTVRDRAKPRRFVPSRRGLQRFGKTG